jgi:N-acetylglucosamine-6-phosphate deacetylase
MTLALVNGRVLLPQGIGEGLCVLIEGGRIAAVAPEVPAGAERIDCGGGLLLPGFIDTQVNGGGGLLFNDAPSVETLATMAAAHRRTGTTGMLPTLISDDLSVVAQGIAAVDAAIEQGVPGILGIHIEGPFLNLARRGIHDAARIRRLDPAAIELLCSLRNGRTLVTLAPECAGEGDVAALASAGVIVAAGHTEASYEQIRAAIGEGLAGFTHLFNAMSPFASRAPGATGAALEDGGTIAGLIVDGHHLHPAAIRLALKAKGAERLMLVTDAMSLAGTDRTEFLLQGRRIRRDGDRLVDDQGTLAGSTLVMTAAVRNMVAQTGIALESAVAMASAVPAAFLRMGAERGAIAPGLAADLLLVDDALEVRRSWIGGREAA